VSFVHLIFTVVWKGKLTIYFQKNYISTVKVIDGSFYVHYHKTITVKKKK